MGFLRLGVDLDQLIEKPDARVSDRPQIRATLLLIYINVCAFQIGHFYATAERICHDALGFKGLDIRSRPLTFQLREA